MLTEGFNEIACGGRPDKDGMEGQGSNITNQANTPVELLELEYPIRIDEYGFVPDTEGPGRFRGGLAMSRSYTFLDDGIEVRVRSDRAKRPPWGIEGGGSAPPARVSLEAGGAGGDAERVLPSKSMTVMRRGDRLRTQWCGGGRARASVRPRARARASRRRRGEDHPPPMPVTPTEWWSTRPGGRWTGTRPRRSEPRWRPRTAAADGSGPGTARATVPAPR